MNFVYKIEQFMYPDYKKHYYDTSATTFAVIVFARPL